ncbi:unnamed protein product [Sphagnum tenellum]
MGPVMSAIMVTGQAGAAMAAQISSMRITEQIDALEVMAVDPFEYLVAPRIAAGVLMMPLLAPVKYNGFKVGDESSNREEGGALSPIQSALNWLLPEARAEKPPVESKGEAKSDDKAETKSAIKSEIKSEGTEGAPESVDLISTRKPQSKSEMRNFGREIPVGEERQDVQHLVSRVDELVQEMSGLTGNLKKTLNPEEMKRTMDQLNVTLQSANKTLSPESGLNQTAQRTLAKLEDAIDQFRDQATRINKGEGSLGMILNRPEYAEELAKAIKNINRLLNKVEYVQFKIDIGGSILPAYSGGRAWFNLGIWPNPTRYFLFGVTSDPRGKITNTLITTTTVAGGVTVTNSSQTQTIDQTSLQITAMIGKLFFERLDLSVGVLYGDGAASVKGFLGPQGNEKLVELRTDLYFRTNSASLDDRLLITYRPHPNAYVSGGVESFVGLPGAGAPNYTYGAGITFNDDDIKLLFTLR